MQNTFFITLPHKLTKGLKTWGYNDSPKNGGSLTLKVYINPSVFLSMPLSIYPTIDLSICLSNCLSTYLSSISLSLSLSLSLCPSIYPSVQQSIYPPVYLTVYLPIYQSISLSLSLYLSIDLPLSPSIYISIYPSIHPSISPSPSPSLSLSLPLSLSPHSAPQIEGGRRHLGASPFYIMYILCLYGFPSYIPLKPNKSHYIPLLGEFTPPGIGRWHRVDLSRSRPGRGSAGNFMG